MFIICKNKRFYIRLIDGFGKMLTSYVYIFSDSISKQSKYNSEYVSTTISQSALLQDQDKTLQMRTETKETSSLCSRDTTTLLFRSGLVPYFDYNYVAALTKHQRAALFKVRTTDEEPRRTKLSALLSACRHLAVILNANIRLGVQLKTTHAHT